MNTKISGTTFLVTQTVRIAPCRGFRLLLLFLLALVVSPLAFGDSLGPCQAGTLATITDTTCTIGDKIFSFGTPDEFFALFPASAVSFVPDPANTGFILGGNFSVADSFVKIAIPVAVATLNGQPTILGATTFSGGGVGRALIVTEFVLCDSSNSLCITPFANTANTPATQTFPAPVSSLTGSFSEATLFASAGPGFSGSFDSATFV